MAKTTPVFSTSFVLPLYPPHILITWYLDMETTVTKIHYSNTCIFVANFYVTIFVTS